MRDLLRGQPATFVLMLLTGLVSLAILVSGNLSNAATVLGFIPARVGGFLVTPSVLWWLTPLTATLIHGGLLHLVTNFILFAYCGRQVESVLGPGPLVVLYVIGAYAAAAGQYLLDPMSTAPMIGASGAISALVGAYALSFGKPKRLVVSFKLNRWLGKINLTHILIEHFHIGCLFIILRYSYRSSSFYLLKGFQ